MFSYIHQHSNMILYYILKRIVFQVVNFYFVFQPEGTEKEFNNPVLISLGTREKPENGGRFSKNVDISFPPKTVDGSRRIRASVIGQWNILLVTFLLSLIL